MIAVDAVKRTILLVNRFGLYLAVPAFLIIAYAYTSSIYPQYRVTAKIVLKNTPAEMAISDIRSKRLVQKALNELPFQASYYNAESPKKEVYGDSLYARMAFANNHYADTESWLSMEVQSANSVALTHADTSAYYEFNKPVSEPYGKFKLVQNTRGENNEVSYIVRIENPTRLLEQYYNSLRVKTADDDNTLTISVLSGNPQKGADFINKLLQLYDGGNHAVLATLRSNAGSAVIEAKKFSILERPETNAEDASISPFWIYIISLLAGLSIPLSRKIKAQPEKYVIPVGLFNLPKLVGRINHRFVVKQME
jgi:hypothetical protein